MLLVPRRIVILSRLSPQAQLVEKIAVGSPAAKALREGDTRIIIWTTYLLYPASGVEIGKTMQEVERFLTTEEGYQLGAYLECEIHLDHPFDEKRDADQIREKVAAMLTDILERSIGVPRTAFRKVGSTWTKK